MTGGAEHWLLPDEPFESWAAYLAHYGSSAALDSRSTNPATIIEELERSGLRGRGGAGFPTGLKWRTIANHTCPVRYVTRTFTYDDTTPRKRPDWTYEPPLELVPSVPHSEPEGSVGVRLDPDVASALRERGSATGQDLDAIANEILRAHL